MLKIQMQNILNIIDSIPEVPLDITDNIIKSIDSFDVSEMSITDIRSYIEYARQEIKKNLITGQNDCYNKLLIKLTIEKENRPFDEQFPDINTNMDKMIKETALLLEANKIHSNQIGNLQNINAKRDKQLEKFVNDSVVKYIVNGMILVSGYKYKTEDDEDGELDGMVIGKDEDGKNTVIFVETKSDMNSGWRLAQKQMNRTIAHWRFLKEIASDDNLTEDLSKYKKDIDNFKVMEFKNYKVKCAFGANEFSQETVGQFKQFNRYRWLRIVKVKDDGFQVIRHS